MEPSLNSSKSVTRLVEITMTRGSSESGLDPKKVIFFPRPVFVVLGKGVWRQGGLRAYRDGSRTSDLAGRRSTPNGRPRIYHARCQDSGSTADDLGVGTVPYSAKQLPRYGLL